MASLSDQLEILQLQEELRHLGTEVAILRTSVLKERKRKEQFFNARELHKNNAMMHQINQKRVLETPRDELPEDHVTLKDTQKFLDNCSRSLELIDQQEAEYDVWLVGMKERLRNAVELQSTKSLQLAKLMGE